MMDSAKIVCVVGARPNFMKAAPVISALRMRAGVSIRLIHTGQHYDEGMSGRFFQELDLPSPDLNLEVGSGSHAEQTGQILMRLEPVLARERPDLVMIFGDVNSTLAASLCSAKLGIPVAHVEAGLRSFDRTMPEELNRIVTDQLSDYLFVTEPSGRRNLLREGIAEDKIFFVGNTMVDTLLYRRDRAAGLQSWRRFGLAPGRYGVLTLHRPGNVDRPEVLAEILAAVLELAERLPIVFPCHPRTRPHLARRGHTDLEKIARGLFLVEPLGYLDFLSLMSSARIVLTDSGGIQEETTVLGVPCLTLRENTERPITVEQGTNALVGTTRDAVVAAAEEVLSSPPPVRRVPDLWDGHAAERIAEVLARRLPLGAVGARGKEGLSCCAG
jgi:UDP-N-acetylglucosamine 2-epimerase (non-hydrolysing)